MNLTTYRALVQSSGSSAGFGASEGDAGSERAIRIQNISYL